MDAGACGGVSNMLPHTTRPYHRQNDTLYECVAQTITTTTRNEMKNKKKKPKKCVWKCELHKPLTPPHTQRAIVGAAHHDRRETAEHVSRILKLKILSKPFQYKPFIRQSHGACMIVSSTL